MQHILTNDQLLDLRVASELSDVPLAAWINLEGCHMPVVCFHNWILPKDCFVQLWFWCMVDGRVYTKYWDHESWSLILQELNPHMDIPKSFKDKVLGWIYERVGKHIKSWHMDFKREQFDRVLDDLREQEHL